MRGRGGVGGDLDPICRGVEGGGGIRYEVCGVLEVTRQFNIRSNTCSMQELLFTHTPLSICRISLLGGTADCIIIALLLHHLSAIPSIVQCKQCDKCLFLPFKWLAIYVLTGVGIEDDTPVLRFKYANFLYSALFLVMGNPESLAFRW